MKTRLRIAMLYVKAGLIFFSIGPISGILWIITGNAFVDKITKPIFKRIEDLYFDITDFNDDII